MKKVSIIVVAVLVMSVLVACGAPAAETVEENPLVGKWVSTIELLSETYEFKADGTGHNENAILAYDFKYEAKDGVLSIYAEIMGMASDDAMEYEYTIDGDTLRMTDVSLGTDYEFVKE